MLKVRLLTDDLKVFVSDVLIPPFNVQPDVLIWGDRVFVPAPSNWRGPNTAEIAWNYREAFAYCVPELPPLKAELKAVPWSCEDCSASFSSLGELEDHRAVLHREIH